MKSEIKDNELVYFILNKETLETLRFFKDEKVIIFSKTEKIELDYQNFKSLFTIEKIPPQKPLI